MKIVITNSVAVNGGDAAILQAIIQLLHATFRREPLRFVIFDRYADAAQRYYPHWEFHPSPAWLIASRGAGRGHGVMRRFRAGRFAIGLWLWTRWRTLAGILFNEQERMAVEEHWSADAIVSTGGTYLVPNYGFHDHLLNLRVAVASGAPLVFFTQSLGPFGGGAPLRRLKAVFEYATLILVRDLPSQQALLSLGVDPRKVHVCADAAFALNPGQGNLSPEASESLTVAVSVRDWPYFTSRDPGAGMSRYLRAIADAVTFLVDTQNATRVTFVSTCQGVPEYWTDDSLVARHLVEHLLAPHVRARVSVDSTHHTPAELMEILARFSMVIATRMHVAVLAMNAGTPVLPIAYERKTTELFRSLHLDGWVQDIESVTGTSLSAACGAFLAALPEIREQVAEEIRRARASAEHAAELVEQALPPRLGRHGSHT
jgi:colanic acid/amylovoran biosynthesis protein